MLGVTGSIDMVNDHEYCVGVDLEGRSRGLFEGTAHKIPMDRVK
jgi:hypothetical protein